MLSRLFRALLIVVLFGRIIGTGFAQDPSAGGLPLPEDPVVLPTDAEVARHLAAVREGSLKSLQHDEDGWDDLWFMVQKAHDKNYRLPGNRSADTDGDGFSDYEEMLVNRNATYREPIYTKEEQIELIRQERRQAIRNLAAAKIRWAEAVEAARPSLRDLIPPGQYASAKELQAAEAETAALRLQAERSRVLAPVVERSLDTLAWRLGVPRVIEKQDGRRLVLSGESEGAPVFMGSLDTLSAAGVGADEVWPIQQNNLLPDYFPWPWFDAHTGLALTGAGQTLAMWEAGGGVLTNHQEFGSGRVFQKDLFTLPSVSNHATEVAGTMAAAGMESDHGHFRESRGVAFKAQVFAYDIANYFVAEREAAAAGNATDPPVRLSNHSWGASAGWSEEDIDPSAVENLQWFWYGSGSFEETNFGRYLSDQPTGAGSAQIDHFLHTTAPHHMMVFACGNDREEGPEPPAGGVPLTYHKRTGATTYLTTNTGVEPHDWKDGDEGGYDTILPPATSKNVLSVGSCEDLFFATFDETFIGWWRGGSPLDPLLHAVPSEFSGAGPTDDGRIKPDLVAVGSPYGHFRGLWEMFADGDPDGPEFMAPTASGTNHYAHYLRGTSMAAPLATGGLGLALERRAQLSPGLPAAQAWRGSTLKALAIGTCDDVTRPFGWFGPDYRTGYGILNVRTMALLVGKDHEVGRGSLIKEFTLAPGESVSWVVHTSRLEPHVQGEHLEFSRAALTLCWSDPAGPAPPAGAADVKAPMLVNNLNLQVENLLTGQVYHPWVLRPDLDLKRAGERALNASKGIDNINTVEKISEFQFGADRGYKVTVTHAGGLLGNPAPSPQVASVIMNGVAPALPVITGLAKSPVSGEYLLTFTADPGAYLSIQTSTDLINWTTVNSVQVAQPVNSALVTAGSPAETKRFWRLKRGQ